MREAAESPYRARQTAALRHPAAGRSAFESDDGVPVIGRSCRSVQVVQTENPRFSSPNREDRGLSHE